MTFNWPVRILAVIGFLFLLQSIWSISSVRVVPLPVNHDMPKFSDVQKKLATDKQANMHASGTTRLFLQNSFARLKKGCTPNALSDFAQNVVQFYASAVGSAHRAKVTRVEDSPNWTEDDRRIDNFVAALVKAGVLRPEHFGDISAAEGRIPLSVESNPPHLYPDWAEPPLTLGCPRA